MQRDRESERDRDPKRRRCRETETERQRDKGRDRDPERDRGSERQRRGSTGHRAQVAWALYLSPDLPDLLLRPPSLLLPLPLSIPSFSLSHILPFSFPLFIISLLPRIFSFFFEYMYIFKKLFFFLNHMRVSCRYHSHYV